MKNILVVLALFVSFVAFGQSQKITVDDIWGKYMFYPNYVPGFNFMNDGEHYTTMDDNIIFVNSIKSNKEDRESLFEWDLMNEKYGYEGKLNGYTFSDDESKILLKVDSESIYRRSSVAHYYVYDVASKTVVPVLKDKKIRDVSIDPTNKKVAYVFDNNIYYLDLVTNKTVQVTTDGKMNEVINGAADWVYEEEFSITKAYEWNADGTALAYVRFDEKEVPEFIMTNYTNKMYPEYVKFKYPKVGENNSKVQAFIYTTGNNKTLNVDLPNAYEYIPRLKWTKDPNELIVFSMNRHQNELYLNQVNATSGKVSILLKETSKYYVDIHDNMVFLPNNKGFLWTSEKDGYNHVYHYNNDGSLNAQLTKGKYDITRFYGYDKVRNAIYYQAAKKNPMEREIYMLDLNRNKERTIADKKGTNSAQFSSTFDFYTLTHSAANQPAVYKVFTNKGKKIKTLVDNARIVKLMDIYQTSNVEFMTIPTPDVELNSYIIKPNDFDPKKKYPVLMFVYGGPGSQTVKDSWGGQNYWWFQSLAQEGYIVVSVDNRGTGARGEEFKKQTYKELGKYEIEDQINAAKYLASKDWVDGSRIGMFGWSYGGYMSSLAITKGADVFKAAIAVAPVTNWKWYDSVYTERYMRTNKENEKGYENNSPVNFAELLKGNYLLVHGNSDDNVHFQHAAEMANALIKHGKQFDTYFYPNRNHGIYGGGARKHLFTKMTNFIKEKL